jgi:large subunit ribosomal protein L24
MKILKGDKVLITKGKDRGKSGKVLKSLPKLNKVIVEGLNKYKKNQKPKKEGEKGQIVEFERPINVSNLSIVCPKCKKQTRVGYLIDDKNKKSRICVKCKAKIS